MYDCRALYTVECTSHMIEIPALLSHMDTNYIYIQQVEEQLTIQGI